MRYIELKPIKTQVDIDRTKNYKFITDKEMGQFIKDKKETKIITPKTLEQAKVNSKKTYDLVTKMALKVLKDKKYPLAESLENGLKTLQENGFKVDNEEFQLNNAYDILMDFVHVIKMNEDKSRIETLYQNIYEEIGKNLGIATALQLYEYKTLKPKTNWNIVKFQEKLSLLSNLGLLLTGNKAVRLLTSTEFGEGNKTDSNESAGCKPIPNPKGLITTNTWNLKPHITSIKNQRKRGTCSAFGTVAAVETATSVKYQRKYNLSEQDLYKKQKLDWNPNLFDDYYGDGYSPLLSLSFQILFKYIYPLEKSWEYNQSTKRNDDKPNRLYTHSCDLYAGDCSDTNHQAHKECYKIFHKDLVKVVKEVCDFIESIPILGIFGGWVCDLVTEVVEVITEIEVCIYDTEIPPTSRLKVSSYYIIWDPIFNTTLSTAKYLLAHNNPIIFCFTVPESFRNLNGPDGNGYIVYDKNEKKPDGAKGHCVAIVGHVDNADLPANVQKGAGGGYFIIKNSWGKCKGDLGFYYAPYDWVSKWGTSMIALTNVEKV